MQVKRARLQQKPTKDPLLIFDADTYSPLWITNFFLTPVTNPDKTARYPQFKTHSTLGCLSDGDARWRLEPGLGGDFEISETLLLHGGFRLTFPNDQVYELLHVEPGLLIGRLPARAKPELFAMDQSTEQEEGCAFLTFDGYQIGLHTRQQNGECHLVLAVLAEDRAACKQRLQDWAPKTGASLQSHWKSLIEAREAWCSALPDGFYTENPGVGFERLQALIEEPVDGFNGPWIRHPTDNAPHMSLALALQVIPAIAITQPRLAANLVNTLLDLPRLENGGWAENYHPEAGIDPAGGPAQPRIAAMLAGLPPEAIKQIDRPRLLAALKAHIESFLAETSTTLPQWPVPDSAFTPEVTDPDALVQFDLAAMLVLEIEAYQKLGGEAPRIDAAHKQLKDIVLQQFWSEKPKRFLDKTLEGEFAGRVTAGALIPLLWENLDKAPAQALSQCLRANDELRSPQGIRQWQEKKQDPLPPPLRLSTQHLLLPLLGKLPGESAALLSADWHRLLEADPTFSDPGTAALWARLIPYASRVNPHLERYPAWVRSLEKHRKVLVTLVAAILLLIPAGFGIYFAVRSDYNLSDELLEAGHAQTLVTMGNLEQAEEVYTRLLTYSRKGGRQNQYFLNRGGLRFKQENYEGALGDYRQSIALDAPGNLYKARWNLGQTYARLGQYDQAIEAMQAFIDEYGEELPSYQRLAENAISLWQK